MPTKAGTPYVFDEIPVIIDHVCRHDCHSQPSGLVEYLHDQQVPPVMSALTYPKVFHMSRTIFQYETVQGGH